MLDCFSRFAIGWVPDPTSPLGRFGIGWTGWCAETGMAFRPSTVGAFNHLGIPGGARRFGLVGLLHRPFRIEPRHGTWPLDGVLGTIAEKVDAFVLPPMSLALCAGRLVIAPPEPQEAVRGLTRSLRSALRPLVEICDGQTSTAPVLGQGNLFEVRPESFHIPLTDPLTRGDAERLADHLRPIVSHLLGVPRPVDEIALLGAPHGGPMRVLTRAELGHPVRAAHPMDVTGRLTLAN